MYTAQTQVTGNKYLENAVNTASPAQLLIMLCDGAIKFCKLAVEDIKKQDYIEANMHLGRAQDIISEFVITLDRESPVAETLLPLYGYFQRRLTEANVQKSIPIVEEVLQFLIELKETWMQAALQLKKQSEAASRLASGGTHG